MYFFIILLLDNNLLRKKNKMNKINLLLAFILLPILGMAQNQNYVVKGVVTAYNHYPLKDVVVKTKKSKITTTTNEKGEFILKMDNKDQVVIEAEGFRKFSKKIEESKMDLKVNLIFLGREKNFRKAVSNGYIHKEDLAYAVDNYSAENNDFIQYNNIYDLIRAKSAGVEIIQEGGRPQFQIRGVSSFQGSQAALLVVDGNVVQDLSFLSPFDVARISVLKGTEASIYGVRGANGVIVIETKKGFDK